MKVGGDTGLMTCTVFSTSMDVSPFQDGLGMRLVYIHVNSLCMSSLAHYSTAQGNHESPLVFAAFDKQILQPIGSLKSLKDNNMKFRTFVCLAMSKGMLCDWLEALPKQKGIDLLSFTRVLLRLGIILQEFTEIFKVLLLVL